MIKYTKSELVNILNSTSKEALVFSNELKDKAKSNPYLTGRIKELEADGERLRGVPTVSIPFSLFRRFDIDGDRTEFQFSKNGYFIRRNKLQTFAILSWLYGREEDISALEDIIWAINDEYTWALPAHLNGKSLSVLQNDGYTIDLFAAETAQALSEILALVGDKLTPILVERTKRTVRERVLDRVNADFGWKKSSNNWSAVCGGCVGMTAMYECFDNDELAEIILITFGALEHFFSGFSKDGACLEGLSYWNYGFGYFISFAEMLRRRTNGQIDLFLDPQIKNIAMFSQKCFFPGARTVSFSDGETRSLMPYWIYSFLPTVYPDMPKPNEDLVELYYPTTGCFRFASELRNYVFGKPDLCSKGDAFFGTYILPYAEWYISSGAGISIAAKGGHNKEPHNHNDVGSFQVYKNGEEILLDVGRGVYNKAYFSEERYNIFCNSSRSHNLPIINGKYQKAGRDACSSQTKIDENGIATEISSAYDVSELERLERNISFDRKSGVITLVDSFFFSEMPESVVERFISSAEPVISNEKVLIKKGNEEMAIYYGDCVFPVMGSETDKDHSGNDRVSFTVDFIVKNPNKDFSVKFIIK